jgi:phosphoribosyl-AMP cyclohydrolase
VRSSKRWLRRLTRCARERPDIRQNQGVSLPTEIADLLKRDPSGLVAAVVQEDSDGQVLMVGWMNDEALMRTLTTGRATYWSRSRQEFWVKGETSGHYQEVVSVSLDCDGDALLVRVRQHGPACHSGQQSCFHHPVSM